MAYTGSKAFAAQGTQLQRGVGSPLVYTTLAEITNIQRSGSKADRDDVTNMDSTGAYREYLATLLDAGEVSFTGNYVPSDTSQQALQTDFDARTLGYWKIVLPTTSITTPGNTTPGFWSFRAFVDSVDFDLPFDKAAKLTGKLKISGKPTYTGEAA